MFKLISLLTLFFLIAKNSLAINQDVYEKAKINKINLSGWYINDSNKVKFLLITKYLAMNIKKTYANITPKYFTLISFPCIDNIIFPNLSLILVIYM